MTRIYMVTGNKGGVGKSLISALAADAVIRGGGADGLVVADCESADGQSTMRHIFDDKADVRAWDLSRSKGYEHMLNDVSAMDGKTVVIDTGAALLGMLNEHAGLMNEFAKAGFGVEIIFVSGHNIDSSAAFRRYAKAYRDKDGVRTVIVLNAVIPDVEGLEDFDLARQPDIRAVIEKRGVPTLLHPYIDPEYARWLMDDGRLPSEVLADGGLPFGTRLMYKEWFSRKSDPVIRAILEGGDHDSPAVA